MIRHRLANYFLLMVFKLCHVQFIRRAAAWIARTMRGPINPEGFYAKEPVMEQRLLRAKPLKNARPDVSTLPDARPEDSDLEKWLAGEAQCGP